MYITKTEGIVVRSYEYGEGHSIVVVLTEQLGKIRAVAKGSRKMKSKFGASLEPVSENHFLLYRKPLDGLYTITGCKIIDPHMHLREDMHTYGYAALMAEGVDLLCAEEDRDPHIYGLFKESINRLSSDNPAAAGWLYFFRLLKFAGYRLNFFNCIRCGTKDLGGMFFSPGGGGIICAECRLGKNTGWRVSKHTLRVIKMLPSVKRLEDKVEDEIANIVKKFIKYQFDRDLKSLDFMKLFNKTQRERVSGTRIPAVR